MQIAMTFTMSVIGKTLFCLAVILSVLPKGRTTPSPPSLTILLQQGASSTSSNTDVLDEILTTAPEPSHDPFRFLILCAPGSKKRNTCEKCTKVTRDPNTYKMCCENTEGVREWCEMFLNPSIWMKVENSIS